MKGNKKWYDKDKEDAEMKQKRKLKRKIKYTILSLCLIFLIAFVLAFGLKTCAKTKEEKEEKEVVKKETKKEVKQEIRIEPPKISEEERKKNFLENIDERLSFFKEEYLDRYVAYKEKHPTYKTETVIVDVNMNFDYPFYENTKQADRLNSSDILVNKYHYLPNDYVPKNLTAIKEEYAVSGMKLVDYAKDAFEEMASAAKEEGYTIRAMSSYRSYDYQKNLYNRYVRQDGQQQADTYSARAGYSEHQTGLAVDIDNGKISYTDFENTKEFGWMQEHAHEYGFILRYPKSKVDVTGYQYESWHYRYVGKEIAKRIHETNMTYDEYYVRYVE